MEVSQDVWSKNDFLFVVSYRPVQANAPKHRRKQEGCGYSLSLSSANHFAVSMPRLPLSISKSICLMQPRAVLDLAHHRLQGETSRQAGRPAGQQAGRQTSRRAGLRDRIDLVAVLLFCPIISPGRYDADLATRCMSHMRHRERRRSKQSVRCRTHYCRFR